MWRAVVAIVVTGVEVVGRAFNTALRQELNAAKQATKKAGLFFVLWVGVGRCGSCIDGTFTNVAGVCK